jgi:monoterpene epsilon-lactone hydrolase
MLEAAGTDVRLEIWPGQMHVFQAANRVVPEADLALRRAARFIVSTLQVSTAAAEDAEDAAHARTGEATA